MTSVIHSGGEVIESRFVIVYPFATTAAGTIGVTVDWTLALNDLDIYLIRGTNPCTLEQFNNRQCPWLGTAESKSVKPERLSVPNLAAGSYSLYIANFGNSQESMSFQITLTSTAGTRAASTPSATGSNKSVLRGMAVLR